LGHHDILSVLSWAPSPNDSTSSILTSLALNETRTYIHSFGLERWMCEGMPPLFGFRPLPIQWYSRLTINAIQIFRARWNLAAVEKGTEDHVWPIRERENKKLAIYFPDKNGQIPGQCRVYSRVLESGCR
jgi:hypothetical protein